MGFTFGPGRWRRTHRTTRKAWGKGENRGKEAAAAVVEPGTGRTCEVTTPVQRRLVRPSVRPSVFDSPSPFCSVLQQPSLDRRRGEGEIPNPFSRRRPWIRTHHLAFHPQRITRGMRPRDTASTSLAPHREGGCCCVPSRLVGLVPMIHKGGMESGGRRVSGFSRRLDLPAGSPGQKGRRKARKATVSTSLVSFPSVSVPLSGGEWVPTQARLPPSPSVETSTMSA